MSATVPVPTFKNHSRDEVDSSHIEKFICKELSHAAMAGPFAPCPFQPWLQCSPMMTIPKKNSSDKRIIIDLSYPKGKSMNAGVNSLTLPTIATLSDKLVLTGKGSYIWTADLARAYHQLRVCPLSVPLLGIKFKEQFYLDIAQPFGCRTFTLVCTRTTCDIVWLLRNAGYFSLCYLDDFIGVEPTKQKAEEASAKFNTYAAELGLQLASYKCTVPKQITVWLGFCVPKDKLDEIIKECTL